MKTFPFFDPTGKMYAVEVDNGYISLRELTRVLREVEGVSQVELSHFFSRFADDRARFDYLGREFLVIEPWGDSSRYWIGPAVPSPLNPEVVAIEKRLQAHRLSPLRRFIANLLSLQWH